MAPAVCPDMPVDPEKDSIVARDMGTTGQQPAKELLQSPPAGYKSSQKETIILVTFKGPKKITAVDIFTINVEKINMKVYTKYVQGAKPLSDVSYVCFVL